MGLFIRFVLSQFFKAGLLPLSMLPAQYRAYFVGQKIFKKRSLVQESADVFSVSPMPSEIELQEYYSSVYWSWRGPKTLLTNRDVEQFNLIRDYAGFTGERMLNFGAGPGGVSYLFWAAGGNIVNIEPSGIESPIKERWRTLKGKENFSGIVDVLASSHSLEHVIDLDKTIKWMYDSLADDGVIFIEVPNSRLPENGGNNGRIVVPHTYYFTMGFFETLPFEVMHLETYKELGNGFHGIAEDDRGEVIRFIGRKTKCP